MTYEEIVAKVKKQYRSCKPANAEDRATVQFDITGEGEGAFYVEVVDGAVNVEPYEYYDHDMKVVATADALMEILEGKTDIINANLTGKIHAEGDLQKAEILAALVKKPAAKKTTAAAKKPAAKKTTAAKKPAAKKPAAKKPAAKKTTATAAKKPAAKKTAK